MSTYSNPNDPKSKYEYTDCPELLHKYLQYLTVEKNLGKRTINSYYIDIALFFKFLTQAADASQKGTPVEQISIREMPANNICAVTEEDIVAYLYFLAEDRHNSAETRLHKISSLKSFYGYLTKRLKVIEKDPTDDIIPPSLRGKESKQPIYLTVEQSETLLKAVSGEFKERDYCIISLFLNCGMRLTELTGINISHMSDTTIKILGKGNKERTVYLNQSCIEALANYREIRDHLPNLLDKDALFVSKRTGKRIGNRAIEKMLKRHLSAAGLSYVGCTPHKLRHTAATMYYQSGLADLKEIAGLLGHASTKTTERYSHLDDKKLAVITENSPLNKAK